MQTAKKKLEVASLTDCHSSRSSLGWKISGPHRHAFCSPFPAVGSHDRPVFPLTTPVVVLMNALFKLFPKQSPTRRSGGPKVNDCQADRTAEYRESSGLRISP